MSLVQINEKSSVYIKTKTGSDVCSLWQLPSYIKSTRCKYLRITIMTKSKYKFEDEINS